MVANRTRGRGVDVFIWILLRYEGREQPATTAPQGASAVLPNFGMAAA
jgi:hypothetical protein